jgi:predicted amidohydrolase
MNLTRHHEMLAVTIGIAQASTTTDDDAERLPVINAFAAALARQRGNTPAMLILPELFLSGYARTLRAPSRAADSDDRYLPLIRDIARGQQLWIVTGLARSQPHGITNSAVAIRPDGQVIAEYDKVCLFGEAEKKAFAAGREIIVFDSPLGRTALAICFDVEQADLVNQIARAGATNLLVPTANMSPYEQVPLETLPARAAEAGVRIVYANHAGIDGDLKMLGQSTVIDSTGKTLALLGDSPELAIVHMDQERAGRLGTVSQPAENPSLIQ